MAHPNQELLGRAEAVLVINVSRTLLGYLDSKLAVSTTQPIASITLAEYPYEAYDELNDR